MGVILMVAWKNQYIKPNKYSRPQTKLKGVRKIVLHWTANFGAGAENHYRYFNNLNGRYASAHLFVDKNESLCIIPLNEVAYHCNDGSYRGVPELKPNGNLLSIGVEMCVEKDGSFHHDTVTRTVDVVAELCKIYNLDPLTDVVTHHMVTRKNCPAPWVKNASEFIVFKAKVKEKMNNKSINNNLEDDDIMKFTNQTTKNAIRDELSQFVSGGFIDKSWLTKFDNDTMTVGDYLALKLIVDQRKGIK